MSIRAEAEENLRVIRSLMEKATIYRAISAPGALIGGLCSIAVAVTAATGKHDLSFFPSWLGVLAISSLVNLWLLRRDALRRHEPFVSPGMRLALRSMLPGLVGGGLCICLGGQLSFRSIAALWMIFYGVSLLAAAHFAPRSIHRLGRAFFAAGALCLLGDAALQLGSVNDLLFAHLRMGATFGLFHLLYAACTWPRRVSSVDSVPAAV